MAAREKSNNKAPQLPEHFSEIKDIQLFFEPQSLPLMVLSEPRSIRIVQQYNFFCTDATPAGIFRPPIA